VVGGGLVGAAIGWGIARKGLEVAVLDGGDADIRASRANFGLVWVQGKGDGMPAYADWTRRSADLWKGFAHTLSEETGIDCALDQTGGIELCLSDDELAGKRAEIARMKAAHPGAYECEMLDRAELDDLLPGLGPAVLGGSLCPRDGHVNPLLLLRALHAGLAREGAVYLAGHAVEAIEYAGGSFTLRAGGASFAGLRVVIAAGLASAGLAPEVGLDAPVRPQRGQILVTERLRPFLDRPVMPLRQTAEGTLLIGDSHEDVGMDPGTDFGVMRDIAARAVAAFPALAGVRVLRAWGGLRILTPDGFPVYGLSETCPGAYVAVCHSGVTLAAAHALDLAPAIAEGHLPGGFEAFSARRFHVPQAS
jgi:glycine/D-amino acid oxidase-like deaminating enzyme